MKELIKIEILGPLDNLHTNLEDALFSICRDAIIEFRIKHYSAEVGEAQLAHLIYEYLLVYNDTPEWIIL